MVIATVVIRSACSGRSSFFCRPCAKEKYHLSPEKHGALVHKRDKRPDKKVRRVPGVVGGRANVPMDCYSKRPADRCALCVLLVKI